jgi:hypothetical protein
MNEAQFVGEVVEEIMYYASTYHQYSMRND